MKIDFVSIRKTCDGIETFEMDDREILHPNYSFGDKVFETKIISAMVKQGYKVVAANNRIYTLVKY